MCEATANGSAAFMYMHIGVCVFVAFSLRVATPTYGM